LPSPPDLINLQILPSTPQMDAAHTQTVAQAVAAATQQAQQAAQQQHAPSPPVQAPQQSSTIDNLTCQWQGCGERTDSAESLYVSLRPTALCLALMRRPLIPSTSLTSQFVGPRLRETCWPQEHQQPQLDLSVGRMPHNHCQA
jgi:hypothetical protein